MSLGTIVFLMTAMVFLTISALGFVVVMPKLNARSQMKRRIALASGVATRQAGNRPREADGKKRNIQSRLREIDEKQKQKTSLAVKFRQMLRQAGLTISVKNYFIICGVLGVVSGVLYMLLGYHPVGALPFAITVGFGLPRYVVGFRAKRRVKKFTNEFANAVDVIVRGIRSGLPIGECLNVIARESPEPVCSIFREVVESQRIGLTLEQALERAIDQMATAELRFFTIVLSIQAQTGGNLADTLQNLSNILRDRKKMADKVKALSSEARASAMIIGSLPFLMTGLLWLVSPDYIELLFSDQLGLIMIGGGLVWMSMGVFIMKQMVNFEI